MPSTLKFASVAVAATAAAAGLLTPALHAESAVTVVQAEKLTVSAASGNAYTDRKAVGGAGLTLKRKAAITATFDGSIERVVVRVRATTCGGAPKLRARLDGKVLGTRTVKRTRWSQLRFTIKHGQSGPHRVSLAFANPKRGKHCTRQLRFDWVSYRGVPSMTVGVAEGAGADSKTPPSPTPPTTVTTPPSVVAPTPTRSGITRLYVDPQNDAAELAAAWRRSRPADAALLDKIGTHAIASWVGGYSNELPLLDRDFRGAAADRSRVVIAVYGIPHRDGGQYSAGGQKDAAAYRAWIDQVASHIGNRPAIVVVEPDAVPMQMPDVIQNERFGLIAYAIAKFRALGDTMVYLDAGTPGWRTPAFMVPRLKAAGVADADGISVNTSNFHTTNESVAWGREVIAGLGGGKTMVVDTSRNGNGPNPGATNMAAWCNPPGRALGFRPTMSTGLPGVDAFLWIKSPGQSDGSCFGHAAAGVFEPGVALELARNAAW